VKKIMSRLGFNFYSHIGKNKICKGWCLTILPTVMACSNKNEFTFIFGWLFWQVDIYYTKQT